MSDKLKGSVSRDYSGGKGSSGTRPWKPVTPSRMTGKAVSPNWGSYVPIGDDIDGDKNTSSPYATHRGILKGGDKREIEGRTRKVRQERSEQGNPWDKSSG